MLVLELFLYNPISPKLVSLPTFRQDKILYYYYVYVKMSCT